MEVVIIKLKLQLYGMYSLCAIKVESKDQQVKLSKVVAYKYLTYYVKKEGFFIMNAH